MPRFTGQNKKRIDPRYFLQEDTDDKAIVEYGDYDDAPTQADFAQEESDEKRIELYLSVLMPRAKDFMLMLADLKTPAYKDAYSSEELVGEMAAVAGPNPIDLLEEILRALGEDPDDIMRSSLDDDGRF